jgi:hypothetical protein
MASRTGFVSARMLVAAFSILTSAYCLLAFIPFTYHQIHLGGLLPWLSAFARFHPYLYWAAFVAALVTLPNLRIDRTRSLTLLFGVVYGLAGVRLTQKPLLSRLDNEFSSLMWCVGALTPLLWMAILDWLLQAEKFVWAASASNEVHRLFRSCVLAAASVSLVSLAGTALRSPGVALNGGQWAAVLLFTVLLHGAVFFGVFLLLNFTRTVGKLVSPKPATDVLLHAIAAVAIVGIVLRFVVFGALSFSGWLANGVALAMACCTVAFAAGVSARLYRSNEQIDSALSLLLLPCGFLRRIPPLARAAVFIAASGLVCFLLAQVRLYDWGYLIQSLIMLAAWACSFAFFYQTTSTKGRSAGDWLVIGGTVLLCVWFAATAVPRLGKGLEARASTRLLEDYSNYDVSFRLARGVVTPKFAAAADDSLFAYLASSTNIPRSVRTDPIDVNLVQTLAPGAGPKPNIFIFVVDSLRRDYLSPYNPAVTFTPNMESFARESVVVRNAFTRYSGTGLSEPSLWTGGMLLHKQYVTPFYPMNSLQKLLDVEGYQQYISKDEILSSILAPSPLITQLDAGRSTMSCELCQTLIELRHRMAHRADANRPVFAYMQPQDIHVSVINRDGSSTLQGEAYPGFEGAYASRIRKMDACFGEFIQFLKNSGWYRNSIIIVTSDHGDSLGEGGRWGHAYNVVPEVVRIPLLIHLPATMQSLAFERGAPAFLVDITPSLYYLLGHRPIVDNELFGRPLFTSTPEEGLRYVRESYLIASSYAPVYGILGDSGRSLYVVDGVSYKEYLYQWQEGSPAVSTPVTPEIRAESQRKIRQYIGEIGRFYGFPPSEHIAQK